MYLLYRAIKVRNLHLFFGTSRVDYTFYPSGTVNIEVSCSNHPFRLQTEEDRSRILVFFGQLRQVLISILMDSHERIVPDVLEWEITQCDINKDIKVSDWFQLKPTPEWNTLPSCIGINLTNNSQPTFQ